jgi:hypothetical protein
MEENLYDRIGETDFNPTYVDGQVLQHIDMNKIVSITKEGVNENYHDIQRLQNGEKTVGNAEKLSDASLSRNIDEALQADDNKVPSSQQVKEYVDGRFEGFNAPVRGVDYWTVEDQQQVIDVASREVLDYITDDINEEVEKAKEDIENTAFTSFDVIDGKLIAYYSIDDRAYDFQLNENKLEVVLSNE